MKKIILNIVFCYIYMGLFGQITPSPLANRNSCVKAQKICGSYTVNETFNDTVSCSAINFPQYFKFKSATTGQILLNTYGHTGSYSLYGPLEEEGLSACQQINLGYSDSITQTLSGSSTISHEEGFYILRVYTDCIEANNEIGVHITISARSAICKEEPDCRDCIGSFAPDSGKYILSAWTKGKEENKNTSYENPGIAVVFDGPASDSSYFTPSGLIIDGWQRIDGVVKVPIGANNIKIGLYCEAGDCLFDDIRFLPIDGSMKSYVYDPSNLKLVAELDERNYATFYEYDEEGKLIRVKKETERGIMTIKENRDNIRKR